MIINTNHQVTLADLCELLRSMTAVDMQVFTQAIYQQVDLQRDPASAEVIDFTIPMLIDAVCHIEEEQGIE